MSINCLSRKCKDVKTELLKKMGVNKMKNSKGWSVILLLILIGAQVSFGAAMKKDKMTAKMKKTEAEVKCPVTGGRVDPATAKLKTVYKGKTYYFCCPGCPEQFKKNPEKYIKK